VAHGNGAARLPDGGELLAMTLIEKLYVERFVEARLEAGIR